MKTKCAVVIVLTILLVIGVAVARMHRANSVKARVQSGEEAKATTQELPPLPAGVTELKFSDFFVSPVGPRGLVLKDKLTRLDGQRVRMLGYMVRQEHGLPGKFLFTALPVQIHEHDSALADDLPPATVCVTVPTSSDREIPYVPGLMLLTGTLSVGPREEGDGRISLVRLALDPPQTGKAPRFTDKNVGAGRLAGVHTR
jgi:hypothetical protein